MLAVEHQVHFRDLVGMQHAVLTEALLDAGNVGQCTITLNHAVDDDMGDVNTLGPAAGPKWSPRGIVSRATQSRL